ncbi:glycoside hydrolase superfamily [Sporodiniella umbellata]|nr:glycoside hydrolase superfamily [Sporodiniella umbellata]KAI9271981.1 glycoside hydrolase superfamily [Sporodiniella umbellata]
MKFTPLITLATTLFLLSDLTQAFPATSLSKRVDTNSGKVIVGYFPNWLYGRYTPSQINFAKYTHVYYAFAIQNTPTTPTWADSGILDDYVAYGFPKLLSLAHSAGTKVIVSIGGWSGSTQFSPMAASASNRQAWIQWNVDFIKKFNTDGVDIDWEYPTAKGAGCNAVNNNDVANLNTLVKELRAALDKNFPDTHKEITMAVHITPFGGEETVTDVSGFVPYVDRFHVMAFDVNGAWNSTSGPNAPFHNAPGYGYPAGFVEGIKSWHDAGVPYNKIAGGIAFYGRAQTLTVNETPKTQYNPAVSPNPPAGDQLDGPWQDAYCSSDVTVNSGVWRWSYLRSQGLLTSPTTAASPWIRSFDNVTQTPWLYNPTNKQYISYDDPISLGVKAKYAVDQGLAGLFAWSIEEENGELLDAISTVIAGNPPKTPITSPTGSVSNTATKTSTGVITGTTTATVTTTKSSSTSTSTPTSSGGCSSAQTWTASAAYPGGSLVVYDGSLYKAQWWSQGDTPSPSGASWGVWKLVQKC